MLLLKNKNLKDTLSVFVFLPYLILCITMGGFHNSFFKTHHCEYREQLSSQNTDSPHLETSEGGTHHNSETCQICQWLKTPSTVIHFLFIDNKFEYVCTNPVRYNIAVIISLTVHRFTIRPPPLFSCFSA